MHVRRNQVFPGRVLHEDADFITLEIGKRDDVTFRIAPLAGEDEEPPDFLTVLFVRQVLGRMETWTPWEEG